MVSQLQVSITVTFYKHTNQITTTKNNQKKQDIILGSLHVLFNTHGQGL